MPRARTTSGPDQAQGQNAMKTLVGIIMGSRSDWDTMRHAAEILD
jgi:hypothetical protein